MDSFIIPNVEFSHSEIPSRPFFRKTSKISIKITEEGIIFTGRTIAWTDIKDVRVKFFESNPYIQLISSNGESFNLFFENKFYYRKKAPWFGGSEFITTEFVKVLEEKNLFTVQKLQSKIEENRSIPLVHSFWNISFFIFPLLLLVISIVILYVGFIQNGQIQLLS